MTLYQFLSIVIVTDEEQSTKHLRAFQKLEELGFDRLAIHNALIKTQLDHDKALEILLKWKKNYRYCIFTIFFDLYSFVLISYETLNRIRLVHQFLQYISAQSLAMKLLQPCKYLINSGLKMARHSVEMYVSIFLCLKFYVKLIEVNPKRQNYVSYCQFLRSVF